MATLEEMVLASEARTERLRALLNTQTAFENALTNAMMGVGTSFKSALTLPQYVIENIVYQHDGYEVYAKKTGVCTEWSAEWFAPNGTQDPFAE